MPELFCPCLLKGSASVRLFHSVWILGTVLFLLLVVSSRLLHVNTDNETHHEEAEKKALVKDPVLTRVASSGDQSGKKVDDGYKGVAATEEVTSSSSSSSSSNFEIWDARVGCKEYRKKHQGELGLGFSHNDTVNPSLQQPDAVECGKLRQQHVSILVKKWTWIPETLNNMYSCGCGLTCLWTNTEVLADHPDAHFFETHYPPLKRVRGEPLRAFLELEAIPHRSGSEDLFVSYHASSSVQVTYAGASFHVVRNYYVSPVKQTEALVYWSSSRCVDERQKIASSFLSLLPHHSFGKCLNNVGGQDKIFDMYPKCKDGIGAGNAWSQSLHCAMSHYKFALAIENTKTESYITEKLYYPLDVGTVPIYFGAPNVLDFVPPHSIIDGSKFQTLQELADYVRKVGADPVLYAEYHAWRRCGVMGHYGHTRAVSLDSLPCRLCAAVSQLGGKDAPASGFRTTRVVVKTVATRGFDSDDLQNTHHMRPGIISFHTWKWTIQVRGAVQCTHCCRIGSRGSWQTRPAITRLLKLKLVKKAEKLAVEDVKLDAAVRMYIASYGLLQEGQDQMAFASYQNTASIYIKLSRKDSFFKSDQTQCVVQLLSVYQEGRQDGMKHVVSTSCLCHSLP